MSTPRIARQGYRRVRQEELHAFAAQLVAAMETHPTLAALDQVNEPLKTAFTRFSDTFTLYLNTGSRPATNAKNYAKRVLIRAIDAYADAVDAKTGEDGQLILEAGFVIQQSNSAGRMNGRIPPPMILLARSTGNRGELRIKLEDFFPRAVRSHLFEYSLDRGQTWQNGPFHNRRFCIIDGLPHSPAMYLRVKSIGTGSATSDWSEPVVVAVP
jgi:hypothetical protein